MSTSSSILSFISLLVCLFIAVDAHSRHHVMKSFSYQPTNTAIDPAFILPPAGDELFNDEHYMDRKMVVHTGQMTLQELQEKAMHSALHRHQLFSKHFRSQMVGNTPGERPYVDDGEYPIDGVLPPPSHLATFKSPAGYVCPSSSSQGLSTILSLLPNAEFACVTTITGLVAPIMTDAGITTLISQAQSQSVGWARRNAFRVLGDLCWTYPSTGSGCSIIKGSRLSTIQSATAARLAVETDGDAMNDALWVMVTYMLPYPSIQSRFVSIANNANFLAAVRFRAAGGVSASIRLKATFSTTDMNDLLGELTSSEPSVRSEAAYCISTLETSKAANGIQPLLTGLRSQQSRETDIATKAFIITALDKFEGTNQLETFRLQYWNSHLPNTATRYNGLIVTSGLPTAELGCYLTTMNRQRNAVLNQLGTNFESSIMSPDKPGMTLIIFASKQEYIDYMGAFIRFGVYAGGLYMNQLNTLFTFQRTSADSIISLNELVIHEFGHYLHSRHLFRNYWADNNFFAEPLGWLDEGTAEYWASLNFNNQGCFYFPLRSNYIKANCPAAGVSAAPTTVSTIINLRTGYDLSGVFDYQGGYFFLHFMWRNHRAEMIKIYTAVRAGTYKVANFQSLTGLNPTTLQTEWNTVFKSWCANPQMYDNDTPYCIPGKTDTESQCAIYGHGFAPAGAVQYDPNDLPNCKINTNCGTCERVADNACGWCVGSNGVGTCRTAASFSTAGTCTNTLASTCAANDAGYSADVALNKPSNGAKAVDGDDATFWYSSTSPAAWTVDLQSSYYISSIAIVWRYNSKTRVISVSNAIPTSVATAPADNTFTVVKSESNLPQAFNSGTTITFATPIKARHVRITLSDHYVSAELNSVKVYTAASPGGTTPPPPTASAPGAPTAVSAAAGNGQAAVTYSAPASNGGAAITGYTATSSPGSITASGSTSPITVTGLTNGVAYTFTVRATNSAGTGSASAASNAVTPTAPATAPTAPTGVSASAGNGQATITYSAPASNGGAAITGYIGTASPGGAVATSSGSATTMTFNGLTNGVAYTFTVRAVNSAGTSAASAASAAVTPVAPANAPGAPTAVSAAAGNGQAAVTYSAPASNGGAAITGYTATSSPGSITASGSTSPITVTGLTNGVAYTFTVRATNSAGTGSASAASNAVTPTAPRTVCAAGTSVAGSGCQPCAIGTYSTTTDAASCTACSTNSTTTGTGATSCSPCPAGSYGDNCSKGYCSNNPCNAGTCTATASGYTCSCPNGSDKSKNCAACPVGSAGTNGVCQACAAGSYASATGATACTPCAQNHYSAGGATTCTVCASGSTTASTGSATCTPCPSGTTGVNCNTVVREPTRCPCTCCNAISCTIALINTTADSCSTACSAAGVCPAGYTGASNNDPFGCSSQRTCGVCARVGDGQCGWCIDSAGAGTCKPLYTFSNTTCVNKASETCPLGDFSGTYDVAANRPSTDTRANDNDDTTYWSSSAANATWIVDLESTFDITSIVVKQQYTSRVRSIAISNALPVSTSVVAPASTFETVRKDSNVPDTWNADVVVSFTTPRAARFVKITLDQHYNSEARVNSVQVFAAAGAPGSIPSASRPGPVPVCNTGSYLNGQTCSPCAAGSYSSTEGAAQCTTCPQNTYSAAGASQCSNCAAGTTTITSGSATCIGCPARTSGYNCSVVEATPSEYCACECCDSTTCTPVMRQSNGNGNCAATCAASACPAGTSARAATDPYNCAAQTSCGLCDRVADNACGWCVGSNGAGSCKPVSAFNAAGTCSNKATDSCASGDVSGGSNIAVGRPASDNRPLDGNDATFWYSVASPATWTIDLQSPFNIDSIQLKWRYNSRTRVIAVSNAVPVAGQFPSAATFTTVRTDSNLPTQWNAGAAVAVNGAVKARYVMITLSNHYVEAEINAVSVYAAANSNSEADAFIDPNGVSNFALIPLESDGSISGSSSSKTNMYIGIGVGIGAFVLLLGALAIYFARRVKNNLEHKEMTAPLSPVSVGRPLQASNSSYQMAPNASPTASDSPVGYLAQLEMSPINNESAPLNEHDVNVAMHVA